jgi:CHASE3 domain sensor protein
MRKSISSTVIAAIVIIIIIIAGIGGYSYYTSIT